MALTPTLMPHQVVMKQFIVTHPHCGIWLDVGGAKSLTTLMALAEIRPNGHILVIAPLSIAKDSWLAEIRKWGLTIRTKSLVLNERGKKLSMKARKAIYAEFDTAPPTMYFINQDLVDDLVSSMPTQTVERRRKPVWPFPTVIIDESQEFKNPQAVRFNALASVRDQIVRMIQLSGTPSPQSLLDIWSQVYLLDGGLALGESFTTFRATYFRPGKIVNGNPIDWQLIEGAEEMIHARIKHLVVSAENANLPIPELVGPHIVPVQLEESAAEAYKTFKRDQVIELATPDPKNPDTLVITADNAAILHGKLLQFASGSLYTGPDHDRDFQQVHEAKMDALGQIALEAASEGQNLMVAFRYRSDMHNIPVRLMEKFGVRAEVFDGSREMRERWNAREIPVMLLQPASHGRGLNLQEGGHELIFYTMPDSLEHWIQTIGRLRRIGQPNPFVRVRCLVTEGTIDTRQIQRLERKSNTQAALIAAVRAEVASDLRDAVAARSAA